MSQSNLKKLKIQIEKFKNRVDNFKPTDDVSQNDREISEIEEIISNTDQLLDQIKEDFDDDEELSSQRQLLDKVQEHKNDFEIIKNSFNKKKEEARQAASQELLMQGKLSGVERKKAERDMALDLNKEVDEQGLMLDSIHKNVLGANENLETMNTEAKNQGEIINRVGEKVLTIDTKVKKTGGTLSEMERRICCRKCMLWMGIILLTIANIVMIFVIIAKKTDWFDKSEDDNKKDDSTPASEFVKGIDRETYSVDIDFGLFSNKNLAFAFLPLGKEKTSEDKFNADYNSARGKSIDIGIYWTIAGDDENAAVDQANFASDFIRDTKGDKQFKYHFYFKLENEIIKQNSTLVNSLCEEIVPNYSDCGVFLTKSEYNSYFKDSDSQLTSIKNYILTIDNDNEIEEFKNNAKAQLFIKKSETETIGQRAYNIIKKKK